MDSRSTNDAAAREAAFRKTDGADPENESASTSKWRIPRQVGDFQVITRIGKGGRSHVFTARQRHLERIVALKVLRRELVDKPQHLLAFKREASTYGRCDHPHIVPCYQAGQDGPWHFQALGFAANGDTIRALQGCSRRNALQQILGWIADLASAVEHLAGHGLVHSDIKPANILVHGDGRAMLADLGAVRPIGPDGIPRRLEGTAAYLSPEQARHQGLDPRSDLYSIGASAWHLLAGHAPRPRCDDTTEALRRAQDTPVPALRGHASWVPTSVAAVIDRCLEVDPNHRFQRPSDLAAAAKQVLAGLSPATTEVVDGMDFSGAF